MTKPLPINSATPPPVTKVRVDRANDPDVERKQLNRVLQRLEERIRALESSGVTPTPSQPETVIPGEGDTTTNTTASSTSTVVIGEGLVEGKPVDAQVSDFTQLFLLGGM